MDLFHGTYSIVFFLLFLTNIFATALGGNVTREQKSVAKILTNFLKVPWIDLDILGANELASSCTNDITIVFESADAGEMWAIQMLDAASKIPAGILTGNIWDLGMFDECINVNSIDNPANIQGEHCMVSLSIPTKFFGDISRMMQIQKLLVINPSADVDLSLSISVCVPSSCGIQDIRGLVRSSIKKMPELSAFEVDVAKVTCSSSKPSSQLTLGSILTISFFSILASLLSLCTACDFVLRAKSDDGPMILKNAAKFSLYTNAMKLSSNTSSPDTVASIHGIRFLSISFIAVAHRAFCGLIEPKVNVSSSYKVMHSTLSSFLFTIPFVVDTFFVLSGFFMTRRFLRTLGSGKKFNLLMIYLHRYLRLTPCVAVVLLFVIFIIPHFASGPIWETIPKALVTNCKKNWWTNILYIQNIVNIDENCLPHTWYLAADMRFFWLSPIILYPLFYRPKFGLGILGLLAFASFFAPPVQLGVNRWSACNPVLWSEFNNSYLAPYNRALPYLVGILLGYDVSNNSRQISKAHVIAYWILAGSLMVFCGWTAHHIQPVVIVYNVMWEMVYVSVARLAWSIAMAWVIYACTQGYGGPIAKFLSLPMFGPLGRMSFNIYLVHIVLQIFTVAEVRTAEYMTPFKMIYLTVGDLVLSTGIAFVLCLFIESPMIIWMKLWMSDRSTVSRKHLTTKRAKFLSEVEKFIDSSADRVSSAFDFESIMSRLDFWQTISDDLNTLRERPSKTPAEWLKAWRDWWLKSLEANSIWEDHNRSKGVKINRFEPQTGVVRLEKELMVFLTAMNCDFTDSRSFEEADMIRSKFQANFSNQRPEDPIRLAIADLIPLSHKKNQSAGSVTGDVECSTETVCSSL